MIYVPFKGVDECGAFDNVLTVPLNEGANGEEVRAAFGDKIIPKLQGFAPNLIMISAGFDAHKDDNLANLNFEENDFGFMTEQIVNVANEYCDGKIVSVLEGGYNLESLQNCVVAHVKELCV